MRTYLTHNYTMYSIIDTVFVLSAILSVIGAVGLVIYTELTPDTLTLTLTPTREVFTRTNLNVLFFIAALTWTITYVTMHISQLFEYKHKLFFIGAFLANVGFILTA